MFLMGADQLLGLPSWHAFPEILDLANFAVAGRPGVDLDQSDMAGSIDQQCGAAAGCGG